MKRNAFTIFIAILLVLAIPVTLLCWGFLLPAQYGDTFMGELQYKAQRLRDTEGKRIILVGGSSVAFGVDSALLEQHFPEYQVVNFGMYAALGTTVMLDLSEDHIRDGDIVILIPEQQEQTLSGFFDAGTMWQGVDGAYELLACLTQDQLGSMIGQFPYFAAQKFAWFLQGTGPQPDGVYSRGSFNAYGDVVNAACAANIMPGGFDANTPIRFDESLVTEEFLDRVNAYAQAVTEKGATLWYGFCPMNAAAITGEASVDSFYDALQARLTFPILGDPNDSILEAGWFYDTNFHLNSSGKTVYTRTLIRSIKAMLGDSSPTQIALPAMPDIAGTALWQGDDSQLSCFVIEERDGAAVVTGVTAEGLTQTSLTVPSTWNSLPVTVIAAGAFSGCGNLETLTVQQNIRSIQDGAFSGCFRLAQILMENPTPSACTVGTGLLDGTNATVYVAADALSAYRTDYFWSIHAQHILPRED